MLLQAASSASVGLQQLACDHQSLDLTGPLIDLSDPSVAVVPFRWHLCHIAHPTQDLDSLKQRQHLRKKVESKNLFYRMHTHTNSHFERNLAHCKHNGEGGTHGDNCSSFVIVGIHRIDMG